MSIVSAFPVGNYTPFAIYSYNTRDKWKEPSKSNSARLELKIHITLQKDKQIPRKRCTVDYSKTQSKPVSKQETSTGNNASLALLLK